MPAKRLGELVGTLVLTVALFLLLQTFVAQPYRVEQHSMEPTLQPGTFVMIDKLTPRWAPYERGDIVVFRPPADWASSTGDPYIKRVIGLPGDQVEIRDGRVFVNGVGLLEDYLLAVGGEPVVTEPEVGEANVWTVPIGSLFVLGDHRERSADSRSFGPIQMSDVIGRAWLRYWPLDTIGTITRPSYPELATT